MLNLKFLLLILTSVSLSAIAQIVFKIGMSSTTIQEAINQPTHWVMTAWEIFTHHYVLLGLFCYGFGAIIWLLVLSKIDVSMAYPFVGIGFILTMALGALLLGEQVGLIRIAGTLFVILGVVLVAHS